MGPLIRLRAKQTKRIDAPPDTAVGHYRTDTIREYITTSLCSPSGTRSREPRIPGVGGAIAIPIGRTWCVIANANSPVLFAIRTGWYNYTRDNR